MSIIQANTYPNSASVACSLASLASTTADPPVGRESAYFDNATDLGLDAILDGKITTGTSPTASKQIFIMAWGAAYDGTSYRYPAGITGTNAGLTPGTWWRDVFWPVLVINTDSAGTSNKEYSFSGIPLYRNYGALVLPVRVGLFVYHNTGVALHATGTNHELRITSGKQAVI
jgi:hypothetical protein